MHRVARWAALALLLAACGGGEGGEAGGPADAAPDAAGDAGADTGGDAVAADAAGGCAGAKQLAPCDDGNPCTQDDKCIDGVCRGAQVGCDDGDPCTAGTCDPVAGCVFAPAPGPCNDGNPCTVSDTCSAGGCAGTPISDTACDDDDVCTLDDRCVAGACTGILNLCNDLNPCTQDFCDDEHPAALAGSSCVHLPIQGLCDDVNPCTTGDVCVDGVCVGEPTAGAKCSDGNLCTEDETCQADGTCVGVPSVSCDDGNPCTIDSCLPTGGCRNLPDVGASCDDGDKCTVGDACTAVGTCEGGPKCTSADACVVPSCVPATGACVEAPLDCGDGNVCTADSCDPVAGCVFTPVAAACDDGSKCTTGDACVDGACVGTATVCDASGDTECLANVCDPADGACKLKDLNGLTCDDGDACTVSDVCSGGSCAGTPKLCGDSDPCTDDGCNPATGACENLALGDCEDLAYERANQYRTLVDLPLLGNHEAIIEAATAHCEYYVDNPAPYDGGLSPHNEADGYPGFTGVGFGDRLATAGYENFPMFEVMAFMNDPVGSVDEWVATLYHRIPFVVANAKEMGYGAAQKGPSRKCDTIDFGTYGAPPAEYKDAIIPFPPDGMTNVPTRWHGYESPKPPLPGPYPSGPILTVSFGNGSGTGVSIVDSTINGPDGPVPHVASSQGTDPNLCCGVVTLYPNAPIAPFTTYTVTLDYSRNGVPGTFEWSFTTGGASHHLFLD